MRATCYINQDKRVFRKASCWRLTCMFLHPSLCASPFTKHVHPCSQTLYAHLSGFQGCRCEKAKHSRMIRSIQTSSTDCLSDTLFSSSSLPFSPPSYSLLHFTLPLYLVSLSVLLTFLRQIWCLSLTLSFSLSPCNSRIWACSPRGSCWVALSASLPFVITLLSLSPYSTLLLAP